MENIESYPSTKESGLKRRRDEDEDDGENPKKQTARTRSYRPRRRREISGEEKQKLMEKMLELERQENEPKTSKDLIEIDKRFVEKMLESKTSVLVLERSHTWKAYCRALFCIPKQLTKRPNIESNFRFNLYDAAEVNTRGKPNYKERSNYYHISCMEQIVDLPTLIELKHLEVSGFRSTILDWFENGGRIYNPDELEAWQEIHGKWECDENSQWIRHCIHENKGEEYDCTPLRPEPKRVDYLPHDRTPRLLSEVLALICKVDQIDRIPQRMLDDLGTPPSDEQSGDPDSSKDTETARNSLPQASHDLDTPAIPKEINSESQ